jgi:hypothetical protein
MFGGIRSHSETTDREIPIIEGIYFLRYSRITVFSGCIPMYCYDSTVLSSLVTISRMYPYGISPLLPLCYPIWRQSSQCTHIDWSPCLLFVIQYGAYSQDALLWNDPLFPPYYPIWRQSPVVPVWNCPLASSVLSYLAPIPRMYPYGLTPCFPRIIQFGANPLEYLYGLTPPPHISSALSKLAGKNYLIVYIWPY